MTDSRLIVWVPIVRPGYRGRRLGWDWGLTIEGGSGHSGPWWCRTKEEAIRRAQERADLNNFRENSRWEEVR